MSKRKISLGVDSSPQKKPSSSDCQNVDSAAIDFAANDILHREMSTKYKWEEKSYENIRLNPNFYGFTSKYLYLSADYKEFSSSAEISTLVKLAKLDLQKGTTIAELIFSCCQWFPKKKSIQSLIELGKQNETQEKVVKASYTMLKFLLFILDRCNFQLEIANNLKLCILRVLVTTYIQA